MSNILLLGFLYVCSLSAVGYVAAKLGYARCQSDYAKQELEESRTYAEKLNQPLRNVDDVLNGKLFDDQA